MIDPAAPPLWCAPLWWVCLSIFGFAFAYGAAILLRPRGDLAAGLLALAMAITALLAGQPAFP